MLAPVPARQRLSKRPHGRLQRRPTQRSCPGKTSFAVTSAEYFYDYAGQDPVNGFDLSGTLNVDQSGNEAGISSPSISSAENCNPEFVCEGESSGSSSHPTLHSVEQTTIRVLKSYGVSCIANGAITGAATVSAVGFAFGCGEGIAEVWTEKHVHNQGAAAGIELAIELSSGKRILVDSKFGKGFAKALGQAVCAALYPTCHPR
jgi:hypothetical protein